MRYLSLLIILYSLSVNAQIQPFLGIFDLDSCNFETTCQIFKPDTSATNVWKVGTTTKPFFGTAYSPPNALMTDTLNPYPTSNHSWFDLVLPNNMYYYLGMIVSFRHKYQTDIGNDGGYIEVSYNQGASWHNVIHDDTVTSPIVFASQNLYTKTDILNNGTPAFSGTSNGWVNTSIQWVWAFPLRFLPDTLILRFHFKSDSIQTNLDGWMIDNLLISYADLGSDINELETGSHIAYPNPTTGLLRIKKTGLRYETSFITVYNNQGQQVLAPSRFENQEFELNCSEWPNGLYFFQVYTKGTKTSSGKFFKL